MFVLVTQIRLALIETARNVSIQKGWKVEVLMEKRDMRGRVGTHRKGQRSRLAAFKLRLVLIKAGVQLNYSLTS